MPAKDPEQRKMYAQRGALARWGDRTVSERFWEKVNRDGPIIMTELGPCWVWIANKSIGGYGLFRNGKTKNDRIYAHRYSWTEKNGPIPNGLDLLHHCDNPPCVRPDHLFPGTKIDNMRDAATKNRTAHSGRNGMAKFHESEIEAIRSLYATGNYSQWKLGEMFSSGQPQISLIVRGLSWRRTKGSTQSVDLRSIRNSKNFRRKSILS